MIAFSPNRSIFGSSLYWKEMLLFKRELFYSVDYSVKSSCFVVF